MLNRTYVILHNLLNGSLNESKFVTESLEEAVEKFNKRFPGCQIKCIHEYKENGEYNLSYTYDIGDLEYKNEVLKKENPTFKKIPIKTNFPCRIKTKTGMVVSGSSISLFDSNKIKLDDYDSTEIDIDDILSIDYLSEFPVEIKDRSKTVNTNLFPKKRKSLRWILLKFAFILLGVPVFIWAITLSTDGSAYKSNPQSQTQEKNLEKIANEKYKQITEGMTLEEVNQIIGSEGELEGESYENGIHYETYYWDYKGSMVSIGCDFENGKVTVSGILDSHGLRNSLGESTRD